MIDLIVAISFRNRKINHINFVRVGEPCVAGLDVGESERDGIVENRR